MAGVWAYALSQLGSSPTQPVAALAVTVAALLAVAVAARIAVDSRPSGTRGEAPIGAALREHARRTGVPRPRDPDARGRRRPRAPSPRPTAA